MSLRPALTHLRLPPTHLRLSPLNLYVSISGSQKESALILGRFQGVRSADDVLASATILGNKVKRVFLAAPKDTFSLENFEKFAKACRQCSVVDASYSDFITDATLKEIANIYKKYPPVGLVNFAVRSNPRVTWDGILAISALPKIQHVDASMCARVIEADAPGYPRNCTVEQWTGYEGPLYQQL